MPKEDKKVWRQDKEYVVLTNWASLVGHQDSLEAWGGDVWLGEVSSSSPTRDFYPFRRNKRGSTDGFMVQHTAQLDVTTAREPLTTNKPFLKKRLRRVLNNDELEARLFPHRKLLTDRTTLAKVAETESTLCSKGHDAFNSMKGNVDPMLAADEALEEEFDDEENKEVVMVFDVEFDDSGNDQLNEIGNKTCTGG
ncbi:hypothetical protein Tco_0548611 [Tanacetum coccineum]